MFFKVILNTPKGSVNKLIDFKNNEKKNSFMNDTQALGGGLGFCDNSTKA